MKVDDSSTAVGLIGVGAMGGRIARRLLEGGHPVTVWNRTRAKAAELESMGATVAATPGELAGTTDVVITMVADPGALREVVEGSDGVAAHVRDGTVVVEMSTVGPQAIEGLAQRLDGRADVVEAPVLGSLSEVEHGALTIFAAGERAVVERLDPLLSHLGTLMYVGPRGAGAAAKLVANLTLVGTLTVLGEALALGEALSLPAETTFAVLSATPLAAQAKRRRAPVLDDDYELRFRLALARKDATLIEEAAAARGVKLPVAHAARGWFAEAEKAGLGESDYSAILGYIRSRALSTG